MDQKTKNTLEFHKVCERLASFTSFSAGESLALRTVPVTDLMEARLWQIETQEARILFDSRSDITIGGARDVRQSAANAQRGFLLQPEDLLNIRTTISAGRDLKRKILKLKDTAHSLASIAELIEECPGLVTAIGNTFDERGVIVDSASAELARIRRELQIVHGRIQDKLRALISSSNNQFLQEPTITTRAGRYVVPLMANHKGKIKGIVHDQSNSGATLWIEPFNTVELNNDYRTKQLEEEEEIRRILAELSARVAIQADSIIRVVERLAELDLIFARARYAESLKATMPEFVDWKKPILAKNKTQKASRPGGSRLPDSLHPGSSIWFQGARHPLLDSETVVPVDICLDDETFVVLITGPNTGGKTVSLKTIGLMVLMAQAGLHLPVKEARLTIFDKVFADIGDEQSIEQNLSTFSGHLTNINRMLASVDERSLVLLDELGSGTDPTEGAALAQAITSFLRDIGATTFVATHFPELKVYASQTSGVINASLMVDVGTLRPTFEMSIGMPGRSNALAIARRLGLNDSILDEAMRLIGSQGTEAENLLDSIYELREQISSQEAGTRLALSQAMTKRENLAERLEAIELERMEILANTRRQAEEEIAAVRKEIRQVRKTLRDATSRNKLKKLKKQTDEVEESLVASIIPEDLLFEQAEKTSKQPVDLRVGDLVLIPSLNVKGTIITMSGDEAEVVVGRLHMRADIDELKFKGREEDDEPIQNELVTPTFFIPKESPSMELDLRGRRVDEGIELLERYLDTAFLAKLPWVRIIHGKGTGRLREGVREALNRNGHVASWEEGRDGEGGPGVTVAKFLTD